MLNHLINVVNKILQKAWLSKCTLLHKLSDTVYNMACFVYEILNMPSKSKIRKVVTEWDGKPIVTNNIEKNTHYVWLKYGITPEEYLLFDYARLNKIQKKEFISSMDIAKYCNILNNRSLTPLFDHKYNFYQKFKKYFNRAVIKSKDIDAQFISNNPVFFFKRENSHCGQGAQIIYAKNYLNVQNLKMQILNWDDGICEELIKQNEWSASFNPSSVNTLRIKTITQLNGNIIIFSIIFRMGRKGTITDNAATNGLMANVDIKTGVINSYGYDKLGHKFKDHPDSGKKIIGSVIPKYIEAVKMAKEMAALVPSVRYISWDLALTNTGWTLIEGNVQGGFEHQVTEGHGCKSKFLHLIR